MACKRWDAGRGLTRSSGWASGPSAPAREQLYCEGDGVNNFKHRMPTYQQQGAHLMIGIVSGVARQRSNSTQPPCKQRVSSSPETAATAGCSSLEFWSPGPPTPRNQHRLQGHVEYMVPERAGEGDSPARAASAAAPRANTRTRRFEPRE